MKAQTTNGVWSNRAVTGLLSVVVALAGFTLSAPAAEALSLGPDRVYHQSRDNRRRSDNASTVRVSRDQAADMVRRRTGGKVIGASTQRSGDRVTYRIKVLVDGNVRTYSVDGTSGSIR